MISIAEKKNGWSFTCTTKYSPDDSSTGVGEYLKKAAADGQTAMAVTDFRSVGAFSDAVRNRPKDFRFCSALNSR